MNPLSGSVADGLVRMTVPALLVIERPICYHFPVCLAAGFRYDGGMRNLECIFDTKTGAYTGFYGSPGVTADACPTMVSWGCASFQ